MSGDSEKKKKIAIAVVTSFILVVIGVAVTVGITQDVGKVVSNGNDESHGATTTTNHAVAEMCKSTDYKEQCEESLHEVGADVKDPKEIIKVGFQFVKKKLYEVYESSATLKEAETDPMAKQALSLCKDMLDLAVDRLQESFDKVDSFDIRKVEEIVADIKTWVDSVITYQGTCLDGFENVTSPAAPKIKEAINGTMKFSINVVMMVNDLQETLVKTLDIPEELGGGGRRLLQEEVLGHGDEFPHWIDPARRRLLAAGPLPKPNLVIAQDGSGDVKTFAEAIKRLPEKNQGPFVVFVKAGVYKEYVFIPKNIWNITWIGAGAEVTKVTGNKGFTDGIKTYYTSTFTVVGHGHTFRGIGFENSAGAIKHQAVAITVDGDRVAFYQCRFDGYQDTVYAHSNRQYYRDCIITGTIDFIFGDSKALFQNCLIMIRRPLDNQQNIVVAPGQTEPHVGNAMVIHNCTITADPSFAPVKGQFKSYLARPWKEYAKAIYIQNYIDDVIHPDGWLPWLGTFALDTCFFAEFDNRGPGSDTSHRVKWNGIKTLTPKQARKYVGRALYRPYDTWVSQTGFPYHRGWMRQ